MNKKKFIFIIVLLFIFLILAYYFGYINIEYQQKKENKTIYLDNLNKIENINGNLYVAPFDVWNNYKKTLENNKNIIWGQVYDITENKIENLFTKFLDNNGKIKLMMENYKYKQYYDTFDDIKDLYKNYNNFELKSDFGIGTKYLHSKYFILDSGFWIQTANLTHSSFFKNREHFFYSWHTGVYNSLKRIFKKDWLGKKIVPKDIHPNLLVCNINCRLVIEEYLKNATKSIIIQNQYITDNNIKKILVDKSHLEYKILLSDTFNNYDILDYFGSSKVRILKSTYIHSKIILVDKKYLILSSINLSSNSIDNNREIGIIITNKKIINKFLKYFYSDRESAKQKEKKNNNIISDNVYYYL